MRAPLHLPTHLWTVSKRQSVVTLSTRGPTMPTTEFHEGDMALVLAEYDIQHMTVQELVAIATDAVVSSWLHKAAEYPALVRDQYNNLIGEK